MEATQTSAESSSTCHLARISQVLSRILHLWYIRHGLDLVYYASFCPFLYFFLFEPLVFTFLRIIEIVRFV